MSRVTLRGRYRRSVDLARDVHAAEALDGYVVTATARATLARVAAALDTPDAARAWSVIGPYGGGKSAFALFAARVAEGRADARRRSHSRIYSPERSCRASSLPGGTATLPSSDTSEGFELSCWHPQLIRSTPQYNESRP